LDCERLRLTIEQTRTLLASTQALNQARDLLISYKTGNIKEMNDDLWKAKKLVDSTIHPGAFALSDPRFSD
jgi:hypothetical protein